MRFMLRDERVCSAVSHESQMGLIATTRVVQLITWSLVSRVKCAIRVNEIRVNEPVCERGHHRQNAE